MITLTLAPELETAVRECATRQGTTPELLLESDLRQRYLPAPPPAPAVEGETMADFLKDFIGCIHSSEHVPGGAQMSEYTGRKFGEILKKKREAGKL